MIENALERRQVSLQMKLTVKALISIGVLVLAVVLPQLAHLAVGEQAGKMLLPMYLPVLLGGCLLGWKWGLGVGVLSPVVSFLLTSAAGQPMPAAGRLPFMMVELAVFAVISGLFSKRIAEKAWLAFPAVVLAELVGRAFFLLIAAVFQPWSSLSAVTVWAQIQTGFVGLALQAVVVPLMVMGLAALLKRKTAMTDLEMAMQNLPGHTLALCKDGEVITSDARGVAPMVDFLREGRDLSGFCAADRVVGKAAAMLFVKAGVRAVYAEIISESARALLTAHGVELHCGRVTDRILNRDKTGFCPMETLVSQTEDIEMGTSMIF